MPRATAGRWLLAAACATAAGCASIGSPQADDRLAPGRIWDARSQRFVAEQAVLQAAQQAPIVLLGETHDNAEHHRLQRRVLERLVAAGRRPALVMEQFDREHQAALDARRAESDATPDAVMDAGRFSRRSWQADGYRPLVELALAHGLPLLAGNVSRAEAREIVRDPARADLPAAPEPVLRALAGDIEDSHCGQRPEPALLAGMVAAQRARDRFMAQLLERFGARGAVLIAGAGHVRADRGAPLYMQSRPLVVAFREIDPGWTRLRDFLQDGFAGASSFDFVWFTDRAAREDPCASMPALPRAPGRQ
jgi:uncharacterized iron-regulated protein